jgi:hypothetical protein
MLDGTSILPLVFEPICHHLIDDFYSCPFGARSVISSTVDQLGKSEILCLLLSLPHLAIQAQLRRSGLPRGITFLFERIGMKIRTLAVSALGLACALAAVPALADTSLYSTLGPGSTYDGTGGLYVDGTNYNGEAIGNSFSLSSGATVTDAVLALAWVQGDHNSLTVDIESDSGGLPGGILASLTQVGTITDGLVTFDCSGPGCTLAAGAYWLVAADLDPASQYGWYYSYGDQPANIAYNSAASPTGPWSPFAAADEAFQINGTPVPEPSSFLLLGSGLAGLAGMLRRKFAR